tara:strand:+ start:938 stop:1246 length:309 start_codon:yes stop_codon:yes gene_type:complete
MSEEIQNENEEEVQEPQEPSAVEELVNQITDGELAKAETSFGSLINDKISDALEAQKVAVASTIFNDAEEEIVDQEVENDIESGEIEPEIEESDEESEENSP